MRRLRVRKLNRWVDAELIEERADGVVCRVNGKRRFVKSKNVAWVGSDYATGTTEAQSWGDTSRPEFSPTPKARPVRDKVYLAWIRVQPCTVCGSHPPNEASHHGTHGMGTKPSDHDCLPACRRCHSHHHQVGRFPGMEEMTKEEYREALQARAERYRTSFAKRS